MSRISTRLLVAGFLVVVVGSTASACSEESKPAGRATVLVTQGPDTGDLLAHGSVLVDGKPLAGARVAAVLSPEGEAAENLKVGERVPTWETKAVTTGDDGSWAIRVDPDAVPSTYFPASQDFLNFEIEVQDAHRVAMWGTTAWLLRPARVWRSDAETRPGDAVLDIAMDLGSKKITLTDSRGEKQRSDLVFFHTDR